MSANLDLDDVVAGHPVAMAELTALRATNEALAARVEGCKARAIEVVGWHRNDYNKVQIDMIVSDLRDALMPKTTDDTASILAERDARIYLEAADEVSRTALYLDGVALTGAQVMSIYDAFCTALRAKADELAKGKL